MAGGRYELSYDAQADSLLVRLSASPPEAAVHRRALEGGLLVLHALEDGTLVAWEVRQASLQGPLLGELLARLREASGVLDELAAEAPEEFEEFLAWEAAQDAAYERLGGEVRRKPGGDDAYARVVVNLFAAMDQRCHRTDQRLHLSTLRVVSLQAQAVLYPPIVVCPAGERQPGPSCEDPVLVAEVVPEGADPAQLRQRLQAYEAIPSLRRVLLLGMEAPQARWRVRDEAGRWRDGAVEGRDARLALPELEIELPLDTVYLGMVPDA